MIAKTATDFNAWKKVPELVSALIRPAFSVKVAHMKAANAADLLLTATAAWRPGTHELTLHTDDQISASQRDRYLRAMAPDAVVKFSNEMPRSGEVIVVSRPKFAASVGGAWDSANSALGGPNPLSNAIVSGLLLGGLGYGAGTLAEQVVPERFVSPGSLRKTLGLTGVLSGLGIGALNAGETSRQLNIGYWPAWLTSNNTQIPAKYMPADKQANFMGFGGMGSNTNIGKPYIPVDAFNRATWADASKNYDQSSFVDHTSPQVAAATTGIMSGIKAQTGSGIISPSTVIRGLASAGVGLGVATLAGKTIGALAGLTPVAQEKIQDMGLWGGMLHSVIPPVLGWR